MPLKDVEGVNVTTVPLLEIVPGVTVSSFLIINEEGVIVPEFSGSLKVTEREELMGISDWLFPGLTDITVGAVSSVVSFFVQLPVKSIKRANDKSPAENVPVSILLLVPEFFSLIGLIF